MKTLAEVRAELDSSLPEDAIDRKNKIRVNGAKAYLKQDLSKFEGDDLEAIKVLVGAGGRGGFGGRVNPKKAIVAKLVENGEMTDLDCFKDFNKGPAEMREVMKYAVREVEADERVWITFEDGIYTVVSIGEDEPANWNGYSPLNNDEDM